LEEYIAKKFVDDKAVAKLFEGFGPLSTFSAKIEFAFALGLLPRHVHTDLRTIKKVRNLFAHARMNQTVRIF
jgi:DNA-binding MltR family transcriptional regulator